MATSSNNDHNKSLVTNRRPVSRFNVSYKFPFIACDTSGLAWIRTGDTRIQLMDRRGTVNTTVNTKFGFNDMAISPTGDLLLSDIKNNRIKSVSRNWTIRALLTGRIRTLFSTEWSPGSLCCLDDGDIVVTFIADKKIVMYSSAGDVRQRFWDVFGHPFRISRSKVKVNVFLDTWMLWYTCIYFNILGLLRISMLIVYYNSLHCLYISIYMYYCKWVLRGPHGRIVVIC